MTPESAKKPKSTLFWIAAPLCTAVAVWGISAPQMLADVASEVTRTVFQSLDWFFMGSVTGFLVLSVWLAMSRYGRLKLGDPDSKPDFSTVSWLSMLFAAGMGVGILFWGVAEPLTHYAHPPIGEGNTPEAARNAMIFTNLHWGLHAWGVYAVGALVLAYFAFRRKEPYLAGAPLRAVFTGKWVKTVGIIADLVAIVAIAFGVAGSIVMGVMQLQTGMHVTLGTPEESIWLGIGILVTMTIAFMISAATSLDKGIKILSNTNMALAGILLLFVLATGPTGFLLRTFFTAFGDYVSTLPALTLSLYPYQDTGGWFEAWTLTYFVWWIAWAPFVGIFIARISKGRTIREFVVGVMGTPTVLSILWFAVFGGLGLHSETTGNAGLASLVAEDVTVALFTLYESLPLTPVLGFISLVLIFIFLVTSADSATFVLGMLTSSGSLNPSRAQKLTWGVGLALLSTGLLLSGNIHAVRAIVVLGAIPFTFILVLQIAALLRCLPGDYVEARKAARAREAAASASDGTDVGGTAKEGL